MKKIKKYFKNQPIRSKLIIPILIIQFFLVIAIFYVIFVISQVQSGINAASEASKKVTRYSTDLSVIQKRMQSALLLYGLNQDETYLKEIKRGEAEREIIQKKLSPIVTGSEAEFYFKSYSDNARENSLFRKNIINSIRNGNDMEIENNFQKWYLRSERMVANLDDLNNFYTISTEKGLSSYQELVTRLYGLITILVVGTIASLFLLYNYLTRLITNPIKKISYATHQISLGNYDINLKMNYEDEIGRLSKNINEMAIALEKKDTYQKKLIEKSREVQKRKDQFIGIASHELKTPLTSIKAYIQILKKRLDEEYDPKKTKDLLMRTDIYLNKLNDLISDLLDVTKIQSGKMELSRREFKFSEAVDESIRTVKSFCSSHRIEKQISTDAVVLADKERIQQVYINLLTNAIKYSPSSDKIILNVKKKGKKITSSIKDFGIGIPENKHKKIFSRFYRVDEPSTRFSGLGIGLYLTSEIIKKHGGKIWVESKQGKGSTFHFTVPILNE